MGAKVTKKAQKKTPGKKKSGNVSPRAASKTLKRNSAPAPSKPKPVLSDSRISFVTLGVRHFKESLEFYRDILGLKLHVLQGDIGMFDIGGAVLAIYPYPLLAEDAGLRPGTSGFGGIALAHNVKNKNDVDKLLGRLEAQGVRILKPAQDQFWGGRSGYFADPDGYPWEIAWNPFIKMDANGRLVLKRK